MKNNLHRLTAQRRRGINAGITSFCTANELVLEACLEQALRTGENVLVEATANQVNQFGGYTGMRPADYRDFVYSIADRINFPKGKIILGGDHLGPLVWKDLPEREAMAKAEELVRLFVAAGFHKIHLDTSMRLADDPADAPLSDRTVARRGALLFKRCQDAYTQLLSNSPQATQPVYIIGSEVPVPGGTSFHENAVSVTEPEALRQTMAAYKEVFDACGLHEAFRNIIGVVIQPGVEFCDDNVLRYNRAAAHDLTQAAKEFPDIVLEGHSTDYQSATALREMVEDGIAILKVGPALTFSLRKGLFALSFIERELIPEARQAHLIETLERLMLDFPKHWKKYYAGAGTELKQKLRYSYSDRCRYYFSHPDFAAAQEKLFKNLESARVSMGLLHQYLPTQYRKVRDGILPLNPRALVKDCVVELIEDYNFAVRP